MQQVTRILVAVSLLQLCLCQSDTESIFETRMPTLMWTRRSLERETPSEKSFISSDFIGTRIASKRDKKQLLENSVNDFVNPRIETNTEDNCTRHKSFIDNKPGYYPKILIFSCCCLALTLLVYTVVPNVTKKDSGTYPRLMIQYTMNLFLAFTILAINQETSFNASFPGLCYMFGKPFKTPYNTLIRYFFPALCIQYFMLVAFGFMSMMSYELLEQIK